MQNFISMIMNSLKSMSLTAIIDILVVAFIFYKGYMLIKETRAEQLLKGIAFIIILIPISSILNLSMLYFIIKQNFNYWNNICCYNISTRDKKSIRAFG